MFFSILPNSFFVWTHFFLLRFLHQLSTHPSTFYRPVYVNCVNPNNCPISVLWMKTFFVVGTPHSYLELLPPIRPLLSTRVAYPWGENLPFPVRKSTMINIRFFSKIPKPRGKKKYSAIVMDFFGITDIYIYI